MVLGLEIPDLERVCMGWKFRGAELESGATEIMGLEGCGWTGEGMEGTGDANWAGEDETDVGWARAGEGGAGLLAGPWSRHGERTGEAWV